MRTTLRLRARWLLPVSAAPIEEGELVVEDGRLVEVRARPADGWPAADARDLGDAILMPGLVNAHTHLEYTVMRGLLEDIEFFPWIRELTARKASLTPHDWVHSATIGAAEAAAGGVTCVGDCTDTGAALDGAMAVGLRGIVYQEVFGIDDASPVPEAVQRLDAKLAALSARASGSALSLGVSPHAPYTVRPALMRALVAYSAERGLPLCIHAAESQAEAQWIRDGSGPIGEMCARRSIVWQPPGVSAVAHLHSLGALGPRTLLVHGVQLSAGDVDLVRQTGASWAHCPKSNAKLGNGVPPLHLLNGGGVVGMGTDSVASNNTMDMFEEMRFAVLLQRAINRQIDVMGARDAVEMATVGSARALGLQQEVGTLEVGKQADVAALSLGSLHASPCHDPYSAVVYAGRAQDVRLTLVAGRTVYDEGRFPGVDIPGARHGLDAAARRLRQPPPAGGAA